MTTDLEFILILGARPDFDADESCLRCSTNLDPLELELADAGSTVASCPGCGVVIAA